MYALVKYQCDQIINVVPISFVKDLDYCNFSGKTFLVFWSSDSKDTPFSIYEKQGRILENPNKLETKAVLPGYYDANVLFLAESKEEIDSYLTTKEGRRLLSTGKIAHKKTVLSKKRKLLKIVTEDNLGYNKENECEESAEEEEEKTPRESVLERQLEDKIAECDILSKENAVLKQKYETVQQLNEELQKTIINLVNEKSAVRAVDVVPMYDNSLTLHTSGNDLGELCERQQHEDSQFLLNEVQTEVYIEKDRLAYIQMQAKPGAKGDSLFVKNLAVAIFGEVALLSSSVTGQKCRARKEMISKPPLPIEKLNYLKSLFEERLLGENKEMSSFEKETRTKKINLYISDKISTLLRYRK